MATNRVPEVDAVAAIFLSLTWITTALRCYVKGFMAKSFGIEDWLAILAQMLFTLTAIFALEGISHSMGKHLVEIPLQNLAPAMMYWFSVELAYTVTTGALKLSIAFFLLRIATSKPHRILLYSITTLVSLVTIAYFLFLVFQCHPVSYFWLQFGGETGKCLPPSVVGAMTYTHSGVNAFCDVILALLPVIIVSQLQMNLRTKITVSGILSMGIVAAIAVIIRIPYIKILVDNAQDFLFSSTDVVIWSAIEPGLAITAANMATLRPLFQAFLSRTKLWGSTTGRGKSSGYGQSKSRSRGFSDGNGGLGGRKGYVRSGSKSNNTMDLDRDEVVLKDMRDSKEKVVVTTVSGESHDWDLEGQRNHNQHREGGGEAESEESIGEWPISVRRSIHVTSWKDEDEGDIPLTMPTHSKRRESNPGGATGEGW